MARVKAALDLDRPGIARYAQLAALFRRRIESGDWSVGARIPTLEELVGAFGVARATVRQALGELEAEGLLQRYRAKGTFVTRRPLLPQTSELATTWAALSQAHADDVIELLESGKADRPPHPLPEGLRYAPGYRHLVRLHRRAGVPYLLGNVWIDQRVYGRLPRGAAQNAPMLRLLKQARGVHIARAHQTLTLGTADIETSRLLEAPLNAPVARVRRYACDRAGTLIYVSDGLYRGDHVRLEIDLK
jgi:GntR family transcriptional regulator